MATSIQNLSQLISEFRNLQAKDSVTPESLGYILQQIVEEIRCLPSSGQNDTLCISDLDTMGLPDEEYVIDHFAEHFTRTRYDVTSPGDTPYIIGVLDVFTDSMLHVFTQVFTTHADLNASGTFDGYAHSCSRLHRYFRVYNIASPHIDNEEGTWSPWQDLSSEINPELAELVPTVQTGWSTGTSSNYIYSLSSNANLQVLVSNTTFDYYSNVGSGNKLCFRKFYWAPEGNKYGTSPLPEANATKNGLMPSASFAKLDALPTNATLAPYLAKLDTLPSATELSASLGAKSNIFGYDTVNTPYTVHGNTLFALTTGSSQDDVKKALSDLWPNPNTTYSKVELMHCAKSGMMLYDADALGYVQVHYLGGDWFEFVEIGSYIKSGKIILPQLRHVLLTVTAGGAYGVARSALSETIVTQNVLDAALGGLINSISDEFEALDARISALENT